MGMSLYLSEKLLNHVFREESYVPPENVYLAFFTVAPTRAGGGTEVTGGSYARQIVTYAPADNPTSRSSSNVPLSYINMPACTIVATATMDALVAGNMLTFDPLPEARVVALGENLSVSIGDHRVYFL